MNSARIYIFLTLILLSAKLLTAQQSTEKMFNASASTISVTVGGDFIVTGTFPAVVNERADQFVTRVSAEAAKADVQNSGSAAKIKQAKPANQKKYALRNIILKRNNAAPVIIDLQKFRMDGDFKNNPYLQNDDVLIFPVLDLERDYFSVEGAVNRTGKYQFVEGDKLSDAIYFSHGISKAYDNVNKAEIYRLSQDGLKLEKIVVNVNDDFPLKRGDRIRVGTEETYRKDYKLLVLGEVRFPGYVPVSRNLTTVADAIKHAGGLTEKADPSNTRIFKSGSLPPDYFKRVFGIETGDDGGETTLSESLAFSTYMNELNLLELYRMSGITERDTNYFFTEVRLKNMLDYERVDATGYESSNSSASLKELKMGDVLFVGGKENSVYVFGQVRNPGNYIAAAGKDFQYYISAAGGLGEYAIEDEIWLIRRFSNEWINVAEHPSKVEPGDIIYVQKENIYSFSSYVYIAGSYLGIVGSVATVILLLVQFGK